MPAFSPKGPPRASAKYNYKPLPSNDQNDGAGREGQVLAVDEKEPFESNRWRCIWDPELAMVTLGSCAQLVLKIEDVQNLMRWYAPDRSFFVPSKPYLKVYIDDFPVVEMVPLHELNLYDEHTLDILNLRSMIRLEIKDDDVGDVGFLEISLADITFDREIRGWFELRFMENLELTSQERYVVHSNIRDDAARTKKHWRRQEAYSDRVSGAAENTSCGVPRAFCGTGYLPNELQHNAGELLIRLVFIQKSKRSFFALSMEQPHGEYFMKKDERLDGATLSLQDMADDLVDIKIATVDNLIVCTEVFMRYILSWRNFAVSLSFLLMVVGAWLFSWLSGVLLPLVPALALVLLRDEQMRREMTMGGRNAPFTEEGFERVAKWERVDVMARYLQRLVEHDLQGKVVSQHRLVAIAARCFRNGTPVMSLQELRSMLKEDKEACESSEPKVGQLVLIDEARRAVITKLERESDDGPVVNMTVQYENGSVEQILHGQQAIVRLTVPSIPLWAIPDNIHLRLKQAEQNIVDIRRYLLERIDVATQVVSWKEPWSIAPKVTVWILLGISFTDAAVVFGVMDYVVDSLANGEQDKWYHKASGIMYMIPGLFMELLYLLASAVFVIHYVSNAPWFMIGRSFLKVCFCVMFERRLAPKGWAFFRPAE